MAVVARGAPWKGEWAWTFDWSAGTAILLGPLLAGMAAFEAADSKAFDRHIALPTARRRIVAVVAPLIGPALVVFGAYGLGAVAAVLLSVAHHPTDRPNPTVLILGLLLLLVWGLVGLGLGQVANRSIAGPVAWLGGLAVTVGSTSLPFAHVVRLGASSGSLAGLELRAPIVVAFALSYSALALLAFRLAKGGRGHGLGRLTIPVLSVAVLVSGGWVVRDDQLYGPATVPRWRCSSGGAIPRVCLLVGNTAQLDAWHRGLGELAHVMTAHGLKPMQTYRQRAPGRSVESGEGVVSASARMNQRPPTLTQLADTLATPADCPAFAARLPPTKALDAQHWLAGYVAQLTRPAEGNERDPRVLSWMRSTPFTEQAAWARAAYAKLAACDLTALDSPRHE
jgi:hypothetical protein